jgi:uncharacterized repeat protein (TIGR01451 family)
MVLRRTASGRTVALAALLFACVLGRAGAASAAGLDVVTWAVPGAGAPNVANPGGVYQRFQVLPVPRDEDFDIVMVVMNSGPGAASGVQVKDTLPAGMTLLSATAPAGVTCGGTTIVTCSIPSIPEHPVFPAGGGVQITLKVHGPAGAGRVLNTIRATSASPAFVRQVQQYFDVFRGADVSVTQEAPASVGSNTDVTFSLWLENAGPSSSDVTLVDHLPAGTTVRSFGPPSWDPSDPTWAATTCSQTGDTITCRIPKLDLMPLELTVSGLASTGERTNSVELTPDVPASFPELARSSRTVYVGAPPSYADVAASSADPSETPALLGQPVTYTVDAVNLGPQTASSVRLTDRLPPEWTFVGATPDSGACSFGAGTVTCDLGNLSPHAVGHVAVTVTPYAYGWTRDLVTVKALGGPADPASDDDSVLGTRIFYEPVAPPCGCPPPIEHHKPKLTLTVPAQTLAKVAWSGLRIRVSSNPSTRGQVAVRLPAALAKRLGVSPLIGTASPKLALKPAALYVQLRPKARRALAHLRHGITLSVVVTARSGTGDTATLRRTVFLRR